MIYNYIQKLIQCIIRLFFLGRTHWWLITYDIEEGRLYVLCSLGLRNRTVARNIRRYFFEKENNPRLSLSLHGYCLSRWRLIGHLDLFQFEKGEIDLTHNDVTSRDARKDSGLCSHARRMARNQGNTTTIKSECTAVLCCLIMRRSSLAR